MDIEERVTLFSRELLAATSSIADVRTSHIRIAPVKISTMTITGKTNLRVIPIDLLREKLGGDNTHDLSVAVPKVVKHRTKVEKKKCKFDHQVSIKHGEASSSTKIFSNGAVHGTGFTSVREFLDTTELIFEFAKETCSIDVRLMEFSVSMINASTSIMDTEFRPLCFKNMRVVREHFESDKIEVDFDPERHPALKIIFKDDRGVKRSTAFVFPTGSITVFGSKEFVYIAAVLKKIIEILDSSYDLCEQCAPRKTTITRPLSIFYGYQACMIAHKV